MSGRIVVLISGSGSNMAALDDACRSDDVPGSIVAVVADRKCAGLELAADRGIETEVLEPAAFGSREEWSRELRDRVLAHSPDLVVSAGFMRILSPVFVDAFPLKLINLHPALLPAFPGAHAVRDALASGVKVSGSTVHIVDHLVDHGPILAQSAVEVRNDDTEATLHERIKAVEHELLPHACRAILEGRLRLEDGVARIVHG